MIKGLEETELIDIQSIDKHLVWKCFFADTHIHDSIPTTTNT